MLTCAPWLCCGETNFGWMYVKRRFHLAFLVLWQNLVPAYFLIPEFRIVREQSNYVLLFWCQQRRDSQGQEHFVLENIQWYLLSCFLFWCKIFQTFQNEYVSFFPISIVRVYRRRIQELVANKFPAVSRTCSRNCYEFYEFIKIIKVQIGREMSNMKTGNFASVLWIVENRLQNNFLVEAGVTSNFSDRKYYSFRTTLFHIGACIIFSEYYFFMTYLSMKQNQGIWKVDFKLLMGLLLLEIP